MTLFTDDIYKNFDSIVEELSNGVKTYCVKFNKEFLQDAPEDLLDYEDRYEVSIELPGVSKEDIELNFEKDILNVKAEKKCGYDDKTVKRSTTSRNYDTIKKSYKFPTAVDKGKIEAVHENGILTITLPKTEEAKPQSIKIK